MELLGFIRICLRILLGFYEDSVKDAGGQMDGIEMSRLVRDLCRKHELDREAWRDITENLNDTAKRVEALEDDALQNTDLFAMHMDKVIRGVRGNEGRLRAMVQNNLVDMQQAWQVICANLRALMAAGAQVFHNCG